MYCPKCGEQIAEDAHFCCYCGTQLTQTSQQQATQYQYQNSSHDYPNAQTITKQPNKGKQKIIVSVAIAIVAVSLGCVIGKTVIAPAMSNNGNSDTDKANSYETTITATESYNSNNEISDITTPTMASKEYEQIFSSRAIVDSPPAFNMLESTAFAKVDDGMVEKLEFGYEKETDIVKEMENTLYYPIGELTDGQKNDFDAMMKAEFADIEKLDFCEIDYNIGLNYYRITVTFKNLDNLDNANTIYEIENLIDNKGTLISMKKTEENLLSNGYVKK